MTSRRTRTGKKKRTTLSDVADRAGVSISTVSRILNHYPGIHPEVRDRVKKLVAELGYRPPAGRSKSRGSRDHTIYFLLTNRDIHIPVHTKILQVVERETSERGDRLVFRNLRFGPETSVTELDIPGLLHHNLYKTVNRDLGVVLTGLTYANLLQGLEQFEIPYVVLGNNYVGTEQLTRWALYFDGYQGAYLAARYLIDLGHTSILFIGDPDIGWFNSLYAGYRQAISEAQLTPVAQTKSLSDSFFSNGYSSVEMAFEQGEGITAIFAGCDEIALGAWKALNDRNLSVPRDVSLVGFDDEEYAAFTVPPLSTVRIDTDSIGRKLIARLYQRLENPTQEQPTVILPTTLIKRGTCRPLEVLTSR